MKYIYHRTICIFWQFFCHFSPGDDSEDEETNAMVSDELMSQVDVCH